MNIPKMKATFSLHNYFTLKLRDAETGEVKQTAEAYNVVLDRFYTNNAPASSIKYIQIGEGSGIPSTSDTQLFKYKYLLTATDSNTVIELMDDNTCRVTTTVTSPLGNTGLYTEIGVGSNLITHAMLSDAEGNPVTIEQTDTDILDITAILYITLNVLNNDGYIYPIAPSYLVYSVLSYRNSKNYSYMPIIPSHIGFILATSINKIAKEDGMLRAAGIYANGISVNLTTNVAGTSLLDTPASKNTNYRAGVTVGNEAYYNYFGITPMSMAQSYSSWARSYGGVFCYTTLPNADVFPLYSIEGISVGIGDGETTVFDNPLPMFVKDSEKVYKNSELLVRGVDYTIDHKQNKVHMLSATPGNIATISGGVTTTAARYIPFMNNLLISSSYTQIHKYAISQNSPIFIELDDTDSTIGTEVNYLTLGYFRTQEVSNENQLQNAVFTLSYSTDGAYYEEAASLTIGSNYAVSQTVVFDTINAKYWKLSVDITACSRFISGTFNGDTPIYQAMANTSVLGYEGAGLTFTEAPAVGDVIEMDVVIDRPYKTSNYAIDIAATYDVGRA